jgi:hypothetical protein
MFFQIVNYDVSKISCLFCLDGKLVPSRASLFPVSRNLVEEINLFMAYFYVVFPLPNGSCSF